MSLPACLLQTTKCQVLITLLLLCTVFPPTSAGLPNAAYLQAWPMHISCYFWYPAGLKSKCNSLTQIPIHPSEHLGAFLKNLHDPPGLLALTLSSAYSREPGNWKDSPVNHVKVWFLRSGSFGNSLENSETIQQMCQLCHCLHSIQKVQTKNVLASRLSW